MARYPRLAGALAALLLLALPASMTRAAEPALTIRVDGEPVAFPDAQPLLLHGRILVPVRFVSAALGAQVDWNEQERSVTITQGARFVRLYPSESCGLADCNGPSLAEQRNRLTCLSPACTEAYLLDVAPRIVGNRTYLPLRFVAEALGAQVAWDPVTWTADLTAGQGSGFSASSVQIEGLPVGGQIDEPTAIQIQSDVAGSLLQFYAIEPSTRQGVLLGAVPSGMGSFTLNSHSAPAGRYLIVAGVWSVDRWLYSAPQLVTFTGGGNPWDGDRTAWLSGYPVHRTYRSELAISALGYFYKSQVTWLLNGEPQPDQAFTFRRRFTPADNGTYTLKALLTPADGGPVVETDEITFRVDARSIHLGLGRDQVVNSAEPIELITSEAFAEVEYRVVNGLGTVVQRHRQPADRPFVLNPGALGQGSFTLAATGYRPDGSRAEAVAIPFYARPNGAPDSPPEATAAEQQAFLDQYRPIAMAIYAQTGLSPSLQLAQAIHESGWGRFEMRDVATGAGSFNLFGLKAAPGDSFVRDVTTEIEEGVPKQYLHLFKRFASADQAWHARAKYLLESQAFGPISMVRSNPDAIAAILDHAGYATDPEYDQRLRVLLDAEGLRSLDQVQF